MKKTGAYYNEIDKFAAQWLRNLIAAGQIAAGDVDERSIEDVVPYEIRNYAQCHFFAGIGVWSRALRSAGWWDEREVWTGSCPCQPFSAAGKGDGFDDERHLWPAWEYLIEECRPGTVFGEQVASKDGHNWLDLVSADMEGKNYAFAATDLCAAGVGAPHIRQRLFFVASRLGNTNDSRLERFRGRHHPTFGRHREIRSIATASKFGGMANAKFDAGRSQAEAADNQRPTPNGPANWLSGHNTSPATRTGPNDSFWRDADWLGCRDGKWRPVEPGTFPLAHGAAARVGRLGAYGNAIVAQAASAFIEAFMWANDDI